MENPSNPEDPLEKLRAELEAARAENERLKARATAKKAGAVKAKPAPKAAKEVKAKAPAKAKEPKAKPAKAARTKEEKPAKAPKAARTLSRKSPDRAERTAKGKKGSQLAKARRQEQEDRQAAGAEDVEQPLPRRTPGKPHYLVVVESPAKAKTIKKYLGPGYTVKASVGHLKDLPKSKIGVDIEHGFQPEYHVIKSKEKVLHELKRQAQVADKVFLATDPDREGEAIAWHIKEEIQHPSTFRVMFNEITKKAIQEAMSQPGELSQSSYDSQQARRILDRLVGYQISPLLWKKIRRGLSAGRVQSVAVRLVVEREQEIKAFVPQEYWTIEADVLGQNPPPFAARLARLDGQKPEITTGDAARALVEELRAQPFVVSKIDRRERRRNAPAPFITSKLQQEAANRLGFTAKRTMGVAQRLYEGVPLGEEGQVALITYMRTDSTRLSNDAVAQVRSMIGDRYGAEYLPEEPIVYKTKKSAQDAHEAIRPTSMEYPPERVKAFLDAQDRDFFRLYELIWNRFVACQMKPAVYDQTSADIEAGRALFRASGSTLKFPGYLKVYGATLTEDEVADRAKAQRAGEEEEGSGELPELAMGERLKLQNDAVRSEQHFTQPPPRFSEASLVKELEERGIGRPSTYAAILSTIQDKGYVEKLEGRFRPKRLGEITNEMLVHSFPTELDVAFTAGMEEKLDAISEGEMNWRRVLTEFYGPFKTSLDRAEVEMRNVKQYEEPTSIKCDKCGSPMVIKWGKLDEFLACTGYPECKNTMDFKREADGTITPTPEEVTDEKCDKCGRPMVIKRGRFGRFLACSGYPECKNSRPISIGVACPTCKIGYLTERRSNRFNKTFYGCNRYPDCTFASWDRPLPETCPNCASPYLLSKYSKRDGPYIACPNKECGYRRAVEPAPAPAATPSA